MKLKVERKAAYEAAVKASKILQKGITVYSDCLYLEAKDGNLYFSAYSPKMSLVTSAGEITSDQNFECLFQADSLLPVLQKINAKTVTFEYNESTENLLVKGGSVRLKIRCYEKKQWPGVRRIEDPDFEKETDFLFPAILQTKHSLPRSGADSVLSSFVIEQAKDSWTITALDGHRISSRGECKEHYEHTILLDGSCMVTLENIFSDTEITLMIKDEEVAIKSEETYVLLRSVAGHPFNLTNIYAQTPKVCISVVKEEIQEIIELAIAAISNYATGHERIIIQVNGDEKEMVLTSKDQNGNSIRSTIDIQTESRENIQLALNPKYLLDAIRSLPIEGEITLQLTNSVLPVIIRGDNYVELILPVKIS